ncbi:TonB family protein [Stenotrophomonas tumulicola]|uniref:TonB family protein n=1 Tax=Stenotrophomonas tumulicola TaxID=1685415 RepID=A0A7W3IIY9_9GAMM|nr:TonB family protein [Stenotrophomonas tumulicola]
MSGLLQLLLVASIWLGIGVVLLAAIRPLLLALGGAGLVYRSWWLLPLVLLALCLPVPTLPMGDALPVLGHIAVPGLSAAGTMVPSGWPMALAGLWGLGMATTAVRSWRAQRRFERGMGTLRAREDGSWQASGDPGLPALVGLLRPRIVVGPRFDAQFDAAERELVLQHERNHRRHGDHLANGGLLLLRCVFWFHPLLAWAARCFLRDQELACDARTVGIRPALRGLYATALLKAQLVHPAAPMACHWRCQPLLKERIMMLGQSKRKRLPWLSGQVLVAGLCVAVGGVAWASQTGQALPSGIDVAPLPASADASPVAGDRQAQALKMPPPHYPKAAFEQSQTGEVVLRVDIGADGQVGDVRVLKASNPGVFDDVSIAAARQWTYQAAIKDGRPVASALRIPITFAMDETEPAP